MQATRRQLAGSVHLARSSRLFAWECRPLHADASAALGGYVGRHRVGAGGSFWSNECDGRRAVEAVPSGSRCLDFIFAILPPLIAAVVLSGGFAIAGAVPELLRRFMQCYGARLGNAVTILRLAATALARLGEARGPLPSAQAACVLPLLRAILLLSLLLGLMLTLLLAGRCCR